MIWYFFKLFINFLQKQEKPDSSVNLFFCEVDGTVELIGPIILNILWKDSI